VLPLAKQNASSAGTFPRLDYMATILRITKG
jgi:hypothetical protein